MRDLFHPADGPAEVIGRIRRAGEVPWEQLTPGDRAAGVGKLRLAGVYDDRQAGFFMVRIRIPGGRLRAAQAETIAGLARDLSVRPPRHDGPERFVEITTRQDIQLHWVRFESLPELWRRCEAIGLTTAQACGDTLRNVTSCPVDGLDPAAHLEARRALDDLGVLSQTEPDVTAALPRKFKVAVTGCPTDCVQARLHDLAFTPARQGGQIGFNVHAGGGLSDSPRLASPLDLFVPPWQVADVVRAALGLFCERGDCGAKAVNRFRVMVHQLGPARVTAEIRRRLPYRPPTAGEDLSTWRFEDHLGVHPDRAGRTWVGLCVPLGRLMAEELAEAVRLARVHGDGGIRLTQRQNLVVTGVAEPGPLLAEPLLERLRPAPDPFERAAVACTSAPFCRYAMLDAKATASRMIDHLRRSVPPDSWERLDGLRLHVSGCKASCAQVQAAHVGFRATMARTEEGFQEAFDIAVGGDVGAGRLARWAALGVPVDAAFEWLASTLVAPPTAGADAPGGTPPIGPSPFGQPEELA